MKLKLLFLSLLLPACALAQPAKNEAIAAYVKTLRNDKLLQNASMSIIVIDAKTKKVIASHNPQAALTPASTLKLVTTGMALQALGPDYKFRTALYYDGAIKDSTLAGNLYIVGGGDPTFGAAEAIATSIDIVFSRWATALRGLGINRVAGDIVADESFFVNEETPESWTWGDMGNYYGTCATGLPFCENAYRVVLKPGKKEGDQAGVQRIYPPIPGARFTNQVTTGKAKSGNNAVIYNSHYADRHVFKGTIPIDRDSTLVKGANKLPAYTCIHFFAGYLGLYNIRVDGALTVVSEPPAVVDTTRRLIAYHDSPPLKEIAAVTNKTSNNFYAETLLKAIGVARRHNSSYEASISAVVDMIDSLKIPHAGLKIVDGSGLSRKNYASARFLADFLYTMYRSKRFKDFDYTLAVGESGTMQSTLRNASNKKRLHAKSGSMEGVRAYAGYSEGESGTLIFAILINNFTHKVATIQPKVEKFLELLTE